MAQLEFEPCEDDRKAMYAAKLFLQVKKSVGSIRSFILRCFEINTRHIVDVFKKCKRMNIK